MTLHHYGNVTSSYINPSIIEERKLDVDYILSEEAPDIERIVSLCQAESIQKVQSGRRIGF